MTSPIKPDDIVLFWTGKERATGTVIATVPVVAWYVIVQHEGREVTVPLAWAHPFPKAPSATR